MRIQEAQEKREAALSVLLSPLSPEKMHGRLVLMSEQLAAWYRDNGRSLPWREEPSPYRTWLSEIMLQQTRVETVVPYYIRFLETVPDILSLAVADEMTLHKLWEGLGYYSRVRNLKKGAVEVVERFGGQLPKNIVQLREICGIGEYTAGAIGSIAFGLREPAVDGNLLRVTARLIAAEGDISRPAVKRAFHDLLAEAMEDFPAEVHPGNFNQAMMDLGAAVCTPASPGCENCPVRRYCLAYERGQAALFPVKAPKKQRRVEEKTVLVPICGGCTALLRRPDTGLLAGLWEFPSLDGAYTLEMLREVLTERGLAPERVFSLKDAKHLFTHIEWRMKGYLLIFPEEAVIPKSWTLATAVQLAEEFALPSALRVYREAAAGWLTGVLNQSEGIF